MRLRGATRGGTRVHWRAEHRAACGSSTGCRAPNGARRRPATPRRSASAFRPGVERRALVGVRFLAMSRHGMAMDSNAILTPHEAEQIVDERIEQFGLGALPHVDIAVVEDGCWRVRWDGIEQTVSPMTDQAWRHWLEEHVGPLDADGLQTTES